MGLRIPWRLRAVPVIVHAARILGPLSLTALECPDAPGPAKIAQRLSATRHRDDYSAAAGGHPARHDPAASPDRLQPGPGAGERTDHEPAPESVSEMHRLRAHRQLLPGDR